MKTINYTNKAHHKLQKRGKTISKWINELSFYDDEQEFFEHLISDHFLELSSSELYPNSKRISDKLSDLKQTRKTLIKEINEHQKKLVDCTKNLDQNDIKNFIKNHKKIKGDFENYKLKFTVAKRKIFKTVKELLRIQKRKRLIANS